MDVGFVVQASMTLSLHIPALNTVFTEADIYNINLMFDFGCNVNCYCKKKYLLKNDYQYGKIFISDMFVDYIKTMALR